MKENNLKTSNPMLAREWHPTKNGDLKPEDITTGSSKKVWWKCNNGHEWSANISNRNKGRGCPYCSGKRLLPGKNDLASVQPNVAKEWNFEKNDDVVPEEVFAYSNKKYWWICPKGHEWQASPNARSKCNCPYCGHQLVLPGYNDLATLRPDLLSEWNYSKNDPIITPDHVMQFSNLKVWWKCKICGYDWEAKINNRSNGTGCPNCKDDHKVSESERIIYYYVKQYFDDAMISFRPKWLNKKEIDIFIPSLQLAIEYDGEVWHKNPEKDIQKTKTILEKGIFLVRFREQKCPELHDGSYQISVFSNTYNYSRLTYPIMQLFDFINTRYNMDIKYCIDLESDALNILSLTAKNKESKSLLVNYPDLASEWNYELNNYLKPENVLPGSNKNVWWKCKTCEYTWKSTIANRVSGKGCAVCSGKIIVTGRNDLVTLHPSYFDEWDYEKNIVDPRKIGMGYKEPVWWKCCLCDHKWKVSPGNRSHGTNCPKCAIKKRAQTNIKSRTIKGVNDLVSKYPEISAEWNKERNKPLILQEMACGSNKRVWWNCINGHEWQESIIARTKNRLSCPYCSNNRLLKGFNDLATLYPEIAKEWDYEKNNILTPTDIIVNSSKEYWWKCMTCGYSWKAPLNRRVNGAGCTICKHKEGIIKRTSNLISKGNSLAQLNPKLSAEWNYERNLPLTPDVVTSKSGKKVWWKCNTCNHEWQVSIAHRYNGTGCPMCKLQKIKRNHEKKVINIDTGEVFDNMTLAAKHYGGSSSNISACCRGKTNTAFGYHWKYTQ